MGEVFTSSVEYFLLQFNIIIFSVSIAWMFSRFFSRYPPGYVFRAFERGVGIKLERDKDNSRIKKLQILTKLLRMLLTKLLRILLGKKQWIKEKEENRYKYYTPNVFWGAFAIIFLLILFLLLSSILVFCVYTNLSHNFDKYGCYSLLLLFTPISFTFLPLRFTSLLERIIYLYFPDYISYLLMEQDWYAKRIYSPKLIKKFIEKTPDKEWKRILYSLHKDVRQMEYEKGQHPHVTLILEIWYIFFCILLISPLSCPDQIFPIFIILALLIFIILYLRKNS